MNDAEGVEMVMTTERPVTTSGQSVQPEATATAKLRFTKTEAGRYYAKGAAHTYLVVRDAPERWWGLTICVKESVAGVEISGRTVDGFGCDTKFMACLVAREFEALGEDYKPYEHGHRGRLTEAVGRAYQFDAGKEARR